MGCGCGSGGAGRTRRPARGMIQSPARVGKGVLNTVPTQVVTPDPVLEERRVKEKQRRDALLAALGKPS